jgi:hypothetical protein
MKRAARRTRLRYGDRVKPMTAKSSHGRSRTVVLRILKMIMVYGDEGLGCNEEASPARTQDRPPVGWSY